MSWEPATMQVPNSGEGDYALTVYVTFNWSPF